MTGKESTNWKRCYLSHFQEFGLSASKQEQIRQAILNANLNDEVVVAPPGRVRSGGTFKKTATWVHNSGIGYLFAGAACAAAVFSVLPQQKNATAPSTAATLPIDPRPLEYARMLPADFDLQGNPEALPILVQQRVPQLQSNQAAFQGRIPAQVQAKYAPTQGRFFSWKGELGVAIKLRDTRLNSQGTLPTPSPGNEKVLYIIQLSTNDHSTEFSAEAQTTPIRFSDGKSRRVLSWREGDYAYVMLDESDDR